MRSDARQNLNKILGPRNGLLEKSSKSTNFLDSIRLQLHISSFYFNRNFFKVKALNK